MEPEGGGRKDSRFDQEGDSILREMFSAADLAMSPEEYAARRAHLWACCSLHLYRYRDPALGSWIRRFVEIALDAEELERCRQRFLTAAERERIRKEEAEDF